MRFIGLAFAALMVTLSPRVGFAYESDMHYDATFALAVTSGWSWDDSRVIASADQGVDENKETVAALESDVAISAGYPAKATIGAFHQASRNFLFHSFSPEDDRKGGLFFRPVADQLEKCGKPVDDL